MVHRGLEPAPRQESVWDYPRPPELRDLARHIEVIFAGVTLAYTTHARRVLETSHPPMYYEPPEHVGMKHLTLARGTSFCEWKGIARYYDIEIGERKERLAAWFYPNPVATYEDLRDYVAFYPSFTDACWVDGEQVWAREGDFYGGWITSDIVGPFKGGPGTWGW